MVRQGKIYILDLAAKLDQCAEFLCKSKWGNVEFPPPFGRDALPEVCLCVFLYIFFNEFLCIVVLF